MTPIRFLPLVCLALGAWASAASYTVKAGDTLYSIAKANHQDPVDLMKQNKLTSSTLQLGQRLSVGAAGAVNTPVSQKAATAAAAAEINAAVKAATSKSAGSKSVGSTAATVKSAAVKSAPTQTASSSNQGGTIRAAAYRFLNIPYVLGGVSARGIDCSAYTRAVFQTLGVNLPRTARAQFGSGSAVNRNSLQVGDLVFFNTLGNGVSHVGIYIGNGQFTNANSYYGHTMVDQLSNPYWQSRYVGARRVL